MLVIIYLSKEDPGRQTRKKELKTVTIYRLVSLMISELISIKKVKLTEV